MESMRINGIKSMRINGLFVRDRKRVQRRQAKRLRFEVLSAEENVLKSSEGQCGRGKVRGGGGVGGRLRRLLYLLCSERLFEVAGIFYDGLECNWHDVGAAAA